MNKTNFKRLDENTVMSVEKTSNKYGDKYHHITLNYEDTNTCVEVGFFKIGQEFFKPDTKDCYLFNNQYFLGFRYNYKDNLLKLVKIYDIKSRCDVLTDDEFYNYDEYIRIEENIKNNRYKKLSLRK